MLSVFFGGWTCVLSEASGEIIVFFSLLGLQVVRPAVVQGALCEKCTISLVKRSLFVEPCEACVMHLLVVVVLWL